MSMAATVDHPVLPADAYPPAQRWAHAESHIMLAAEAGFLELTSCWLIAGTYNVRQHLSDLKALKARFRNELSFSGGDK